METLQIEWKVSNNDTTAIAGGAVDSDCWSGEGTSETQSSEEAKDNAPRAQQPRTRMRRKKATASTITDLGMDLCTGSVVCSNSLHNLLLIGDSNAKGYCETLPITASLRQSLAAHFAITLAAKSGLSWGKLGQDVEGTLLQFAKPESLLAGSFDAIATVLGTNDIRKHRAKPEIWVTLSEQIRVVLEDTKKYLRPGRPATAILVTSPFHMEPDYNVKKFGDIMQEVCKAVGVSFIPVKWKKSHK